MGISDDLQGLADLHQRGALSDDEFQRAKARVLDTPAAPLPGAAGGAQAAINAMRRSRSDRWLGGVCGGLAQVTGVASWFWRLLFVLLGTLGGTGVLLYLLAWVLLPQGDAPQPPLQSWRPT